MENVLELESFNELSNEDLSTIDGGFAITTGALCALGCLAVGTAAGLIWG